MELVANSLVLPKQVTDLASAHADIARRNVGFGANVTTKLCHHRLAEAHHFTIAFTFGVKV